MILDLRYYDDPILRKKAQDVECITDEIKELCLNMVETMLHSKGIGLAAPQVGVLLRIFVSNCEYEDEQEKSTWGNPRSILIPFYLIQARRS